MSEMDNTVARWMYVTNGGAGSETGPFTDWERAEIDSVRTAKADYVWKAAK